jgi:hypothetical protein
MIFGADTGAAWVGALEQPGPWQTGIGDGRSGVSAVGQ